MAVVAQQGFKITGEETYNGVDYWIISNSGDTRGYFVDLGSSGATGIAVYNQNAVHLHRYWTAYSEYTFFIDSDWIIKTYSDSVSSNARLLVADINMLNHVYIDGGIYGMMVEDNGIYDISIETDGSGFAHYGITNDIAFSGATAENVGTNYHSLSNIGWIVNQNVNYYPRIDINDLCISVVSKSTSATGGGVGVTSHTAIVLMCPKVKAPAGMSIGDDWPKIRSVPIDGSSLNLEEYQEEWSNYLESVFPQSSPAQVNISANVNKELVTEANTGAVGSFEISEQQIDTIAGWFHNSFVFQWFSMFVLMFVLLFFIKKGMA